MGKITITAKSKAGVKKKPRKPRGGDSSFITAKTTITFNKNKG